MGRFYRRTITKRFKGNGIMLKIQAKKPLLSKKNVKNRLHFATEYLNFDIE